jgi:oxygen-independent coproporphyrinogen III oxidase
VTRVSLGAQSFHDAKLRVLERDHDAEQIARAVSQARRFARSVSLDLIFAAPGETLDDWRRDLAAALALAPDHLSTYGLTYEKGTAFWPRLLRGELAPAEEEGERQMYEAAIDTLSAAGFEHYEVSNFARPGHRSRHNEAYWLGREYYAAGPGAARHLAGRRETNHRSTTTWIRRLLAGQSPTAESELLTPELRARERVIFGLRRLEGIDLQEIARDTGVDVARLLARPIEKHLAIGCLVREGSRLRLTRAGLLVSDAMWPEYLEV